MKTNLKVRISNSEKLYRAVDKMYIIDGPYFLTEDGGFKVLTLPAQSTIELVGGLEPKRFGPTDVYFSTKKLVSFVLGSL